MLLVGRENAASRM